MLARYFTINLVLSHFPGLSHMLIINRCEPLRQLPQLCYLPKEHIKKKKVTGEHRNKNSVSQRSLSLTGTHFAKAGCGGWETGGFRAVRQGALGGVTVWEWGQWALGTRGLRNRFDLQLVESSKVKTTNDEGLLSGSWESMIWVSLRVLQPIPGRYWGMTVYFIIKPCRFHSYRNVSVGLLVHRYKKDFFAVTPGKAVSQRTWVLHACALCGYKVMEHS